MKQLFTFLFVLGLFVQTQAQGKIKNPILRIEVAPVLSSYGSTQSISNKFFSTHYLNKPFIQTKLAIKLNRKMEFNFGISRSSVTGTTENISDYNINNSYGYSHSYDLNYTMISLGIKKFYGKSISPIGKYLEVGLLISKQQASSMNYTNQDGQASVYSIYAENRPSARFAFGKRNLITKHIYFFREFAFCINQYSLNYSAVQTINKRTFYYANSLTNFNILLGFGVVL